MNDNYARRKATDRIMTGVFFACTAIALLPLFAVLGFLLVRGVSYLNLDLFTQLPKPAGQPGGGMANAMVGSLIILGIASLLAIPTGILAAIYLAEWGNNPFAFTVRFVADVLTGVPSITVGVFVYTILVLPFHRFSAVAGAVALAIIMLPIVVRTSEEMLRLVPGSIKEAAYALGAPRWKTILMVVVPAARAGIATGVLLAVARVAGETAPLLFTAFGNRFWEKSITGGPIAALPLQVFTYAIGPYESWHRQAWSGALVLVLSVVLISVTVRLVVNRRTIGAS
jgi:phosphate transport system permease protein